MEAKGLSSSLLNCKCFILNTKIDKYVLPGIANVFKSTPNVEALIMTWSFSSSELYGIQSTMLLNYNEEQYWTSQKWTYKNARVLQKMVVSTPKMVVSTPSDARLRLKEYFETPKKLLSFPKSSPDAIVIFC